MTVKEWLNRGWKLEQEINALLEAQRRALDKATSMSKRLDMEKVQQQSGGPENNMISYAEYSRMIDERIDELGGLKQEILQAINSIEDEMQRAILIERYINHKKWGKISVELHCDLRWLYRLHGKALLKIKSTKSVDEL